MKVKYFCLLQILFIFFVSIPISAKERIIDNAGLLNAQQKALLSSMADSIALTYDFDLVIVTEKSTGNIPTSRFADDFFDNNGYGFGRERDGCLFLHVTESRNYYFSTSGRGIRLLGSTALGKLEADVIRHLKAENPFEAYNAFLLNCETFLKLEAKGGSYSPVRRWDLALTAYAWLIAVIAGFIIVYIWKRKMNSALKETRSDAYIVPGSVNLKLQKEYFLYSTITKTNRENQRNPTGTRTGSSGGTHGGRGGSY